MKVGLGGGGEGLTVDDKLNLVSGHVAASKDLGALGVRDNVESELVA